MNKRFCDLVVGDKLYIYFFYNKNLATRKIFEIIKTEKLLMLECEYNEFSNSLFNLSVNDFEKDFSIITNLYQEEERKIAIATSIDKLLLEVSE